MAWSWTAAMAMAITAASVCRAGAEHLLAG
jgi:hypothetical protein